MDAGACVADGGAGLEGHAVGIAGGGHGAAGGLGDHVEGLVVAVGAVGTEALDASHDDAWVNLLEDVVAQTKALHGAGGHILGDDVSLADHLEEHGLARLALEVEGDAALVQVEEDEVVAVNVPFSRPEAAARVAPIRLFDLDDIGTHPCKNFGARGPRFELGQVYNPDSFKCLCHRILLLSPIGLLLNDSYLVCVAPAQPASRRSFIPVCGGL